MHVVNIYIDTNIRGPRHRPGKYLYIIAMDTNVGVADVGNVVSVNDTTENQATLLGLEAALKRINKPCHLVLYLECKYVSTSLREGWIEKWKQQDWKNARGKPVSDEKIWRNIEYLLMKHEFEVRLQEPHTYRDWMRRTLSEKEDNEDV